MLDLKLWREYLNDITTDSLWISNTSTNNRPLFIIPKRDWNIKNDSNFHGIFIPEIPYQFIRRFLPENGLIWDCFGGSGTTYRVAEYLGVHNRCILTDINPTQEYIQYGDALTYKLEEKADLIFCHPPYHNIVKYSEDPNDGSNKESIGEFLEWLSLVAENCANNIKKGGYLILVLGNIYQNGEEHTLGVWGKDKFLPWFQCKSHIIKDYGETKGTEGKNYNLNFVRQLRGGYNNFYGDNIFILKRK